MCTPATIISSTIGTLSEINNQYKERKNTKYQAQIAINNAKNERNQALNEIQKGIEESRLETIKGIKETNLQKARNAANGFDYNSETNLAQYEDISNDTELNSFYTTRNYINNANQHNLRANSYLNNAQFNIENYNNSLYLKGIKGLGSMRPVAPEWYKETK